MQKLLLVSSGSVSQQHIFCSPVTGSQEKQTGHLCISCLSIGELNEITNSLRQWSESCVTCSAEGVE